ncbi:hypothetical protein R5R35_008693 [Gryllus longicercus]|uniref:Uncharacterized protein n=1 Tax=Gryllus longicercus TaxID=2509291 RepID=A0AAN9VAK8_9ORTH
MKFEFVIKRVTTYQDMKLLLWIFVLLSLVLNGKSDIVEETTVAIHTVYQPTTLINESHEEKHNTSETTRNNVSSIAYNYQTSHNFTSKKLADTHSNTFSSSLTSETFYRYNFTYTTTGYLETLNNNSFNENEIENNNMFIPSSSSLTNNSYNFSKQPTPVSMLVETEIQNKDITLNLEFQNENITTPVTFISNENNEITTNEEKVTSLTQNTSRQNASTIEMENILNVSSEVSKNASYLSHFSSYDLNENNITTTEIPETNSGKGLINTEMTTNILLKNVKNTENVTEEIINNIPFLPTTTDIINTMNMENNTFQETEISSPNLSTLATTTINHSSDDFVETSSVPTMSTNSTSTMIISSSIRTNNSSLNSSLENNNVNKQEDPISINQSSITKNDSESKISTISTQQITVAAHNDKQKEINNFSTIIRNVDFREEVTTISNTPILSITPSSSGSLSDNSVQKTSLEVPINENYSFNISFSPSPTIIQDHHQKEFFFKHINNLTDYQRKNLAVDIIFISAVDIVEWFHSYDRVFRTSVASLLTQANESESIPSINIIYIAPTPLKNEKYFCITFMVESALHKNTYELGVLVVQKIKQNISGLSDMLHLPVESIVAGYNETAIVVILTMCIQKSRIGKQTWEQDEQEWCAPIHGETGRYRSGYQLPINVQNSSNNVVDRFSRVNQKVSLKEQNNSFVSNNGVENVLIHNEEENCSQTCGECNKMFVEDTKL